MRIAVTIIVIIGVLASIGLGITWISDYNELKGQLTEASNIATEFGMDTSSEMKQIENLKNCAYALIAGGIVAFISLILLGKLKKISAVIILLSAVIPAIIAPISLVFTFFLVIGGILAFFVKPKVKVEAAA